MEINELNMIVARNIATIMKVRELDAAKLSRRSGMNPTGIYDILKGKSKSPKVETLGKIAKGLNVPLEALLSKEIDSALKLEMLFVFENLPDHEKHRLVQTGKAWLATDDQPA